MRRPTLRLRRLVLAFLLPLALLLSQQGALLHELSHWKASAAAATATTAEAASADRDLCVTCLAFSQVGHLADAAAPLQPDVATLRHAYAGSAARHVAEAGTPAQRTRGPPRAC